MVLTVCIPSTLTLYLSSSRMKLLVNVLRGILSCWMLLSSHEALSSAAAVQGTACKKTVGELQTRPAGPLEMGKCALIPFSKGVVLAVVLQLLSLFSLVNYRLYCLLFYLSHSVSKSSFMLSVNSFWKTIKNSHLLGLSSLVQLHLSSFLLNYYRRTAETFFFFY